MEVLTEELWFLKQIHYSSIFNNAFEHISRQTIFKDEKITTAQHLNILSLVTRLTFRVNFTKVPFLSGTDASIHKKMQWQSLIVCDWYDPAGIHFLQKKTKPNKKKQEN